MHWIVQFFEDRPYFYDICLLSRKIPVPVGNGTDFSSMCPFKDTLGSRNIVADGVSVHRKHADSFIFNLLKRSFSMRLVAPIET